MSTTGWQSSIVGHRPVRWAVLQFRDEGSAPSTYRESLTVQGGRCSRISSSSPCVGSFIRAMAEPGGVLQLAMSSGKAQHLVSRAWKGGRCGCQSKANSCRVAQKDRGCSHRCKRCGPGAAFTHERQLDGGLSTPPPLTTEKSLLIEDLFTLEHEVHRSPDFVCQYRQGAGLVVLPRHLLEPGLRLGIVARNSTAASRRHLIKRQ